jgi:hypothetical protein
MKLRFQVNQANSFKAGVNADTSIVDLEVDPAAVDQPSRELIARHLQKGIEVRAPDNYSLVEAQAPTLEALVAALLAGEKNYADQVLAGKQREQERKAALEKQIAECKRNFIERKVKVEKAIVSVNDQSVPYEYLVPAFDTSARSHVEGCTEWVNELAQQKEQKRQDAERVFLEEIAAQNLEFARRIGLEEQWLKGYITADGLALAARRQIRAKYGLRYEDSALKYDQNYDLTPEEIAAAEEFRSKLPAGAKVKLTGNEKYSEPNRIVIYAEWTEADIKVCATEILRSPDEDEDEDNN